MIGHTLGEQREQRLETGRGRNRGREPRVRAVARDPPECGRDERFVSVVTGEVSQPLDADGALVLAEPIEYLVEETGIVPRHLQAEEEERLGVDDPVVAARSVGKNADLRPLPPRERECLVADELPKLRYLHPRLRGRRASPAA